MICVLCISVDAVGATKKKTSKRGVKARVVVKPHLSIVNTPFDCLPTTSSPDLYLKSSPYKVATVSYESHYVLGGHDVLECPTKLEYKFDESGRIIEYISEQGCGGTNYNVKYLPGSNRIASINLEYTPEGTDYEEDVTIKAIYIPMYKGDKIISLKETTTSFGGIKTNKTFNYSVSYRDDDIYMIKCVEMPKVYFTFPHFASYGLDGGYHVLYVPSGEHHGWYLESKEGNLYNNESPMKLPDGVKPHTDYQDNWISASWQFTGDEGIYKSERKIGYFWPGKNRYDLEFHGTIANSNNENGEDLERGDPLSWRLNWDDDSLQSFSGQSMHHGYIFTLKGHYEGNVYKVSEFLNDGSVAYLYECDFLPGTAQDAFTGKYYNGNYSFEFLVSHDYD